VLWDEIQRSALVAEKVIGLISGTSHDGVDAVLASFAPGERGIRWKVLAYSRRPYPVELKQAIRRVIAGRGSAGEIGRLDLLLGEFFSKAALKVASKAGVPAEKVDLIGSHGQTVFHRAGGKGRPGVTVQLGEAAVIAERTGITTIADFRRSDMAAGGTGAPLVPRAEELLFRSKRFARGFLNLGGVANLTALPPAGSPVPVIAFDTGPGNSLIDEAMRILSNGKESCDRGGRLAGSGRIDPVLLERLLAHPHLAESPPKAIDREVFGRRFLLRRFRFGKLTARTRRDLLATLTYFTAFSVHQAYARFVRPRIELDQLFLSGGGVKNSTLVRHLRQLFVPDSVEVELIESLGVKSRAKEALSFALLAWLSARGLPGNVPSVTGASRPVVLGKISPGRSAFRVEES